MMRQLGGLVGTMMVANGFLVIIPNQKKVVADLLAGRQPDPKLGAQAKQRSLHNNYLTLPVIFTMIANHYPLAFASRWNWLILAVVLAMGAVIRHFFNTRHKTRSEEHTSELQSLMRISYAVFCLKKKNKNNNN